jgi:hypothetical protein
MASAVVPKEMAVVLPTLSSRSDPSLDKYLAVWRARLVVQVAIQRSRTFETFLRVGKPGMGLCARGRFALSLLALRLHSRPERGLSSFGTGK